MIFVIFGKSYFFNKDLRGVTPSHIHDFLLTLPQRSRLAMLGHLMEFHGSNSLPAYDFSVLNLTWSL